MTASAPELPRRWHPLDPRRTRELNDARIQLHYAADLCARACTPPGDADGRAELEWLDDVGALASPALEGTAHLRCAVRPRLLALLLLEADNRQSGSFLLNGRTLAGAERWLASQLASRGAERRLPPAGDGLPEHPVAHGSAFDATTPSAFDELAHWFADGVHAVATLQAAMPDVPEARCSTDDFALASTVVVAPAAGSAPAKMVRVGMHAGNGLYGEPYFFARIAPRPTGTTALPPLGGDGVWHTRDWTGAMLPAARLVTAGQQAQVEEFISSALRACMAVLIRSGKP